MAKITRTQAREETFRLLFETEFQKESTKEEIFERSKENREIVDDKYISNTYFGVLENLSVIDEKIEKYSNGWKVSRITTVSRCAIRLCVYEMLFCEDIPAAVSVNEAIDLVKKYDVKKMKGVVNGILNSIKEELKKA